MNEGQVKSAIAKLNKMDEADFIVFTKEEAKALREVAVWWTRLKGAAALGGAIGSIAKWGLLMAAFIAAMKAGALDWLLGGSGGVK